VYFGTLAKIILIMKIEAQLFKILEMYSLKNFIPSRCFQIDFQKTQELAILIQQSILFSCFYKSDILEENRSE
jgi:hypothetical protein